MCWFFATIDTSKDIVRYECELEIDQCDYLFAHSLNVNSEVTAREEAITLEIEGIEHRVSYAMWWKIGPYNET